MTAQQMADIVGAAIKTATAPLLARIEVMEREPSQAPRDGKDGAPGERGPQGEKGLDGRDGQAAPPVTAEQITAILWTHADLFDKALQRHLSVHPIQHGKDGAAGQQGAAGRDGKDGISGRDGVDGQAGPQGPAGERGEKGDPGRDGKDGAAGVAGKDGAPGERGATGERGEKGLDGAAGRDGRDGITGAAGDKGANGLNGKDGADGRDGLGFDDLTAEYDEQGRLALRFVRGDVVKRFVVPSHVDRGVFRQGTAYAKGDGVTLQGSYWIAQQDAPPGKPGAADSGWRLAVKRGMDGAKGERGDIGERGAPGRDATQLGMDGSKW